MVRSVRELRETSDDELIREHDAKAKHTEVGTGYYMEELDRRSRERSIEASNRLAKQSADTTELMNARVEELVLAMDDQLHLARAARADAEQAERFTRIMAWCSLGVATASLAAAIAAIVVSIAVAGS